MLGGAAGGAQAEARADLLAADAGAATRHRHAASAVGGSTVYRTKRRFVEGAWSARSAKSRVPALRRKLTGKRGSPASRDSVLESPPDGRARWTLELLAGAMVGLTEHESLSGATVDGDSPKMS